MDYEALERLARLKDSGALPEGEFTAQKHRLLSAAAACERNSPIAG